VVGISVSRVLPRCPGTCWAASQVARSIRAVWEGCGDHSQSEAGTGRFLPLMVRLRPNTMYPVYFGLRRMPVTVLWVHPVPSGDG
jgi:hypothetical protein